MYVAAYRDGKLNNGDKVDPDKVREVDLNRPVKDLPSVVGDIKTILAAVVRYGINDIISHDSSST